MSISERNQNIKFTSTSDQLSEFLKKIKDLTAINPRIIIRFEENKVLLMSFVGESFKDIHAFKNYVFSIEEIFNINKGEIEDPIFFIVKDGKKLYKILENFLDYNENIKGKISVDEENYINYIFFNNSKLDIKIIGNNTMSIGSQISVEDVDHLMNIDNSLFNFRLNNIDFYKIKKMGTIDNESKSPLYITVTNKILSIGETKWHLNISEVETEDIMLTFPKSYFNTINSKDFIDIYVFQDFILCKYDDYNLMIVLETTI